jgi:hypothetical protein
MFLKTQNKTFKKLFIIAAFLLPACTSITPPPCVSPEAGNDKIVVRWGRQNENTTILEGYHLDAQGQLFKIPDPTEDRPDMDKIDNVDGEKYCRLVEQVRGQFLKAQTVNVPNPESAFIEYANPPKGIYLRAVWIPKYAQHTSQEFQKLYDSLQTFVPVED